MKSKNVKITPKWSKSKETIWNDVFSNLEETTSPRVKRFSFGQYAAAIAVILIAVGSFSYLYETTEQVGRGSHLAIMLPDGSKVNLNAETKLKYKPYWWFISRDITLNGEAFFEVKPGSQFTVKSYQNEVQVLGTSFNIFARSNKYSVACITGKVKVISGKESVILTPNMKVSLNKENFNISNNIDISQSIGWTQNKFSFIGVPLKDVVEEIERQYNIQVSTPNKLDYLYTGNFSKEKEPEEVLEIVGKPFGITFRINQ